jgi:hypothetical protein
MTFFFMKTLTRTPPHTRGNERSFVRKDEDSGGNNGKKGPRMEAQRLRKG